MSILKRFRKENQLTQKELADYLEVGQGFVSQIENGERPAPKNIISKILANTCGWETTMLKEDAPEESLPSEDKLVAFLKEQNDKLTQEKIELHSRIAVLEYQIMMLEREKGKTVSDADNPIANVG